MIICDKCGERAPDGNQITLCLKTGSQLDQLGDFCTTCTVIICNEIHTAVDRILHPSPKEAKEEESLR